MASHGPAQSFLSCRLRRRSAAGELAATYCMRHFRAEQPMPGGAISGHPGTGCAVIREGFNDRHAIFGWTEQCVAVQLSDPPVALAAPKRAIRLRHGGRASGEPNVSTLVAARRCRDRRRGQGGAMTTDPEGNKNVFQLWKEGGERLPFKVIRGRDATARKKKCPPIQRLLHADRFCRRARDRSCAHKIGVSRLAQCPVRSHIMGQ